MTAIATPSDVEWLKSLFPPEKVDAKIAAGRIRVIDEPDYAKQANEVMKNDE